jgi:hypothetical protein
VSVFNAVLNIARIKRTPFSAFLFPYRKSCSNLSTKLGKAVKL